MNFEQLREFCLSLPYTTEDVKWGNDLCFSVGAQMFCVTGADSTGGVSFKCTPEKFAELTERPGIIPAAYVARYHWVTVEDSDALPKNELKELIKNSYNLVYQKLPKGVRNKLN